MKRPWLISSAGIRLSMILGFVVSIYMARPREGARGDSFNVAFSPKDSHLPPTIRLRGHGASGYAGPSSEISENCFVNS